MSRPTSVSAYSPKPAKTSICRANSFFSSADNAFQSLIASGFAASVVPGGTTPAAIWRASTCSRIASQPASNLPLYLAIHSFGTWCGACVAPGAKYMKNGLSGVSAFWNCIQAIALSVMSVMKL
jgi:hypothetical protein